MIYEAHRRLGSFNVLLQADTPAAVLERVAEFGHVVVWHGADYPVIAAGDDGLGEAAYTGVVRARVVGTGGHDVAGVGLAWHLGDEENKGWVTNYNNGGAYAVTAAAFDAAIRGALPSSIVEGTLHTQTGTVTHTWTFVTPRTIIDYICDLFGCEWRINPDGTIDAGTSAELFVTDPAAILMRNPLTSPEHLAAARGTLATERNAADYSACVTLLGTDASGNATYLGHRNQADEPAGLPYKDIHGNDLFVVRIVNDAGTTGGDLTARVDLQWNRFNRVNETAALSTVDGFELVKADVRPGDALFVYDPQLSFTDPDEAPIYHAGEALTPVVKTCTGIRWGLTDQLHTVAYRAGDGTWTDLTPWLVNEPAQTTYEVGDFAKNLTTPGVAPAGGSGTVKTFVIDHPVDPDRLLVHATVEAPTADVTYRGRVTVDDDGAAIAVLPAYFVGLVPDLDAVTVQVTARGEVCQVAASAVVASDDGSQAVFLVRADRPGIVVDWTATGTRSGAAFDPEPPKAGRLVRGIGPYRFIDQ